MLETISGYAPFGGSEPCPAGQGRYGIDDQMRPQEAMLPGMAVSRMDTTSNANNRSIYKYGNALARPEFYGILTTKGTAPQLTVLQSTTNADTVSVLYAGYAPVLLAPGQVVKPGQYLEPISGGSNQGYFRTALSGHVVARDYADNTGGSAAIWVGADVFLGRTGSGLIGSVGSSTVVTGVTAETAYDKTVSIPAYALRIGDLVRITGSVLCVNNAAGANLIKLYINGIGSGVLATSPSVTYSTNDVCQFQVDARVNSSTSLALSGGITFGPPITATYRAVPAAATISLTAASVVTVAVTPNNNADQSQLLFLSVEKVA